MATSRAGDPLPTARPSVSQSSSPNSHSERSAARCCVFLRKNQKPLKAKTKAESENTQLQNRVSFKYSARSPDSHVSTPAANTVGQTALSTGVHRGSSILYLCCLRWGIKIVLFLVYAFFDGLQRSIRRAHRKMDLHTDILNCRVNRMRFNKLRGDDLDKALARLNAKKDAMKRCSEQRTKVANTVKYVHDKTIRKKTGLLDSILAPFAQELEPQRKLLDFKITTYDQTLDEQMESLTSRYSSF